MPVALRRDSGREPSQSSTRDSPPILRLRAHWHLLGMCAADWLLMEDRFGHATVALLYPCRAEALSVSACSNCCAERHPVPRALSLRV